ncbi:MAG: YbaB/EbfC family nucleoid-associated protein [Oscillospiraceae bacterium]|nr:MAG: YbaB/EbfC family nucleoid-associated protein [Oscillospiraceae bacterium]
MAKGGFGGFGGGANMQQLMRQAQKMQQDMEKAQQELADTQLEASAGGGMVICTVTGMKEIVSLKINPEIVDPEDVEMLEDTVLAAVREAVAKAEELYKNKMGAIAGGMGGLF